MSAKQMHEAAQRGINELDGGVSPHRVLRGFLVALRDLTAGADADEPKRPAAKSTAEKKADAGVAEDAKKADTAGEKAAAEKKGK